MAKVLRAAIFLYLLSLDVHLSQAQERDLTNPIAVVPARWTITASMRTIAFPDGSQVRPILLRLNKSGFGMTFACGFFCRGDCTTFLFAVFMVSTNSAGRIALPTVGIPQVVWAANRAHPVKENATLELKKTGELVLSEADGAKVWSSATPGAPIVGLNITESGNLILFGGHHNQTIFWESFSTPTDSLVPGQKLRSDQTLTSNISYDNSSEGQYLHVADFNSMVAFFNSNPPKRYASYDLAQSSTIVEEDGTFSGDNSSSNQYLRLESNGGLKIYEWRLPKGWVAKRDLLLDGDHCLSPVACGRYEICYGDGQCSCPPVSDADDNFFLPVDNQNPILGCREITPLSCSSPHHQTLLPLTDVSYFVEAYSFADLHGVDQRTCREACARNCSCRAALFRCATYDSEGECFLNSDILSLRMREPGLEDGYFTTFIKVQSPVEKNSWMAYNRIIGAALGGLFLVFLLFGCGIIADKKRAAAVRKKRKREDEEDDDLKQVSGMPRRFSLEELRASTGGFSKKLGQGGFGSVFAGRIEGRPVAVKRLDSIVEGKKQFIAEVQTIGNLHHINLVKLVGYCAENSANLLVYEFMPNSSLDNWLFALKMRAFLGWQTRRKIILGVAKGLAYLHQDCTQKIAHLDVKPQNILLDEEFEPKLSDFGLAKLIDRDQTQVETRMRGTPGYLAPEWLSSMITEKVDVYSFGVVVLEIVTGRKNFDRSLPEDDALLVDLAARKARAGELGDLIDRSLRCTGEDFEEATRILQLSLLCLLHDYKRRPSMSAVVKLLEGTEPVEAFYEDGSFGPLLDSGGSSGSAPLLASVLSGPR